MRTNSTFFTVTNPALPFNFLCILFLMIGSANVFGQILTDNTPGGRSITIPTGVTSISVELWGGGGGGQGAEGNPSAGGGGSGGGYIKANYNVSAGNYNYFVGSGGAASSNGTDSWFVNNTTFLAVGGNGAGTTLTNNNTSGSTTNAPTFGNIGGSLFSTYGGSGANGKHTTIGVGRYSGGGGSSGGTTASGNANANNGGAAPTDGYAGANGRTNNENNGQNGGVGAGGSGGLATDNTNHSGGNGGNGQVRINYIRVTGITPNPVCVGSTITITGANFATGISTVTINGTACTGVTRVNATTITAVVAAGTTSGNVIVTNPNGTNNGISIIVNPLPAAIAGGATAVCVGSSTPAFTNATGGGTWSVIPGTGNGTITAGGVLTGTSAGTVTVRYTLASGCFVSSGPITVRQLPGITTNPTNVNIAAGANASFTVAASNTPTGYTWQVSTDNGVTWGIVTNGGVYSNATTATLNITGVPISMNGYRYLASATNACGTSAYSASATLGVSYCAGTSWQPNGLYIDRIAFVGALVDPPVNPSTFNSTGFQDFTGLSVKAVQAQGEGINVVAHATGNTFQRGTWKAWVDWNKDGAFDPGTEEVYNIQGFAGGDATFGFVIPPGAPPGDYRIRVRVNNGYDYFYGAETFGFDFSPCDNFEEFAPYDFWIEDYGETEDYLFTVVAKCNALITAVGNGQSCGTGTVNLNASATAGVTEFRWYTTSSGGSYTSSAATGNSTTFTTPVLSATTNYYVTAWNGSCESQVRTLVVAKVNPTPVVAFTPNTPVVCGESVIIQLTAGGDKEMVHLIDEDFETGLLGVFSNINNDANGAAVDGNTAWKTQTSTFVPVTNVWFPAISSGFGANKFALAYSDSEAPNYPSSTVENSIALTNSVSSNAFLNLTLKLRLYYSRYYPDGYINPASDEFVNVELSTDGGITYPVILQSFTGDVGIGNRFTELSYDLSSYINQPNLKIRIRHRSYAGGGWLPDGVAVDDIELFGEKSLNTSFNYNMTNIDAFTDAAATIPYIPGTPATSIWLKPTPAQLEGNASFTVPVTAMLSNGCSATGSVVITNNSKIWNPALSTSEWNAIQWLPDNSVPTAEHCVVVKKPVVLGVGADGLAKNITIEPGGSLTVKKDRSLTVTDFIKNETTVNNAANLLVESDANLIQLNSDAVNSGNMTAERSVTDMDNVLATQMDYVYWSAPVTGQKLRGTAPEGGFSPGTPNNRFFEYNESTDYFVSTPDAVFTPGKGYAIRAEVDAVHPANAAGYSETYRFRGIPNNGDIPVNITRSLDTGAVVHGYNLVGNPYPSNISFDRLYAGNPGLIYNTVWLWTNATYTLTQQGSGYAGNNYAVYNGSGGNNATTAVAIPAPNGIIKVGQGFLVQKSTLGTGQLLFKNSYGTGQDLRVTDAGTFYQKGAEIKNRFTLVLTSPAQMLNSQLIAYVNGATNGYEQDYDAEIMGMSSDLFYSVLGDRRLLIQGKGVFTDSDAVPLGANFFTDGQYTVTLNSAEGIFAGGQSVYLKDKQTGIITNLSAGSYSFTAAKGISDGRFEIIYKPETILGTAVSDKDGLAVYRDGDDFVIRSSGSKITGVELYDGAGRLLYHSRLNQTATRIEGAELNEGVYVLKIERGALVSSKKVMK